MRICANTTYARKKGKNKALGFKLGNVISASPLTTCPIDLFLRVHERQSKVWSSPKFCCGTWSHDSEKLKLFLVLLQIRQTYWLVPFLDKRLS